MPEPEDQIAAAAYGSRGRLRASHADREQVIGVLKTAFVQGRLVKGEFDQRVGQALAARTHADLAAVTADLPAESAASRAAPAQTAAAQAREPVRVEGERPVLRPGPVMVVATALYAGVWSFTFFPPWPRNSDGDPPTAIISLFFLTTLIYLFVLVIAVGYMVTQGPDKRSGGQRPRRRARG